MNYVILVFSLPLQRDIYKNLSISNKGQPSNHPEALFHALDQI